MRRVDVNPKKSFNYKVSDYKKGVRDSRNLFTAATLKGGVVTPEEFSRCLYRFKQSVI
jgi:hypothetical protein